MNTITHEGKTYEVLTIDDFKGVGNQPDHARLPGGKVFPVYFDDHRQEFYCKYSHGVALSCWEDLGIQPLRLVPKEPVTFDAPGAVFFKTHTVDNHGHESPRGYWAIPIPSGISHLKRFRCVEIVEEGS
jgi:hypothetical protein